MLVQIHDHFWVDPDCVVALQAKSETKLDVHWKSGHVSILDIDEEWHKRWRPQLDRRLSGQKMVYYVCQRCEERDGA